MQRGAADDGDVVAVELVEGEHLPQFHLHQIDQLLVVHHVNLVQEDRQIGNADLAREEDVLASLRHGAIRRGHHQDATVHLRGAGDHVLDVIRVAGAVDVGVVARIGLVLDVRGGDCDAASLLLGSLVDLIERDDLRAAYLGENLGDCGGEGGLTVVDVANGTDVEVLLAAGVHVVRARGAPQRRGGLAPAGSPRRTANREGGGWRRSG